MRTVIGQEHTYRSLSHDYVGTIEGRIVLGGKDAWVLFHKDEVMSVVLCDENFNALLEFTTPSEVQIASDALRVLLEPFTKQYDECISNGAQLR